MYNIDNNSLNFKFFCSPSWIIDEYYNSMHRIAWLGLIIKEHCEQVHIKIILAVDHLLH